MRMLVRSFAVRLSLFVIIPLSHESAGEQMRDNSMTFNSVFRTKNRNFKISNSDDKRLRKLKIALSYTSGL